ncbi:MAG TPA: hypothetical protein VJR58_27315 [Vineibacter sp.]|nr:hypothetical protein [Vineibacter sp.]
MSTSLRRAVIAAITCLTALLVVAPASAEKPDVPPGQAKRGGGPAAAPGAPVIAPGLPTVTVTISPRDQFTIRQYFGQQFSSGHCPPGLAKKNNGCLPPGQAKKWGMGRPLPGGLPYYPLPGDLLARLLPPPAGYQYIRIANDVLLMATGSRMIVDAVSDLGRL